MEQSHDEDLTINIIQWKTGDIFKLTPTELYRELGNAVSRLEDETIIIIVHCGCDCYGVINHSDDNLKGPTIKSPGMLGLSRSQIDNMLQLFSAVKLGELKWK